LLAVRGSLVLSRIEHDDVRVLRKRSDVVGSRAGVTKRTTVRAVTACSQARAWAATSPRARRQGASHSDAPERDHAEARRRRLILVAERDLEQTLTLPARGEVEQ
jgi:hypothetical protein